MLLELSVLLEDIGFGRYHVMQTVLVSGIMLADGAEILVASCVLGALQRTWHFSAAAKGSMMSVIFLGVFLGNLVGGSLADVFGRRRLVLASYLGLTTCGLLAACALRLETVVLARFVFGCFYGAGGGPAVTLLVECAQATCRGHLVNLNGVSFTLGEMYAATLLLYFMPDLDEGGGAEQNSWRYVTALAVAPAALLIPFAAVFLQESPHFLVARGRQAEALAVVRSIARINNKEGVLRGLEGADPEEQVWLLSEPSSPMPSSPMPAVREEAAVDQDVSAQSGTSNPRSRSTNQQYQESEAPSFAEGIRVMLGPNYRSIVVGGCYMCFLANFLFFGLTYALPQIFHGLHGRLTPAAQVWIISLCDLPGIAVAFLLIRARSVSHRAGLTYLSEAAAVLTLALVSIDHAERWLWLALPAAYLAKYVAAALFTLTYIYLAEVFPSACRCTALSCCMGAGRVGSLSAPLAFEVLESPSLAVGSHAVFLTLTSALCALGAAIVRSLLIFEFKNAPLVDIGASSQGKASFRRPSLELGGNLPLALLHRRAEGRLSQGSSSSSITSSSAAKARGPGGNPEAAAAARHRPPPGG